MSGVELALAIDQAVLQNASVLIAIGKKVNEVRHYKEKCQSVQQDAIFLKNLLDKHLSDGDLNSLIAVKDLQAVLHEVEAFVDSCVTWNFLRLVQEVTVKKRFPALKVKLDKMKARFSEELMLLKYENVKKLPSMSTDIKLIASSQRTMSGTMENLQKLVKREQRLDSNPLVNFDKVKPDMVLDSRFKVILPDKDGDPDVPIPGDLQGVGPIVCHRLQQSRATSLYLESYRDIQAGAYVQRFFGTLTIPGHEDNGLYAVMEDLVGAVPLSVACETGSLPEPIHFRVGVAFDVAKTVAWLHRAEILVKVLDDTSLVLKTAGDITTEVVYPVLTGLHASRKFLERTTSRQHDVRFEAPEFASMKQHSKYSDIWRIGIIIWQCLVGKLPYGEASPIHPDSDKCAEIRNRLRAGELPGKADEISDLQLRKLVLQCWQREAMARPTATSIFQTLLEAYTRISVQDEEIPGASSEGVTAVEKLMLSGLQIKDQEAARNECLHKIQQARALNKASPNKLLESDEHKIIPETLDQLVSNEANLDPVKCFILGAALWWRLVSEESAVEIRFPEEETANSYVLRSDNERRALSALKYLEMAADGGYNESHLEISMAQSLLARASKARYRELCGSSIG